MALSEPRICFIIELKPKFILWRNNSNFNEVVLESIASATRRSSLYLRMNRLQLKKYTRRFTSQDVSLARDNEAGTHAQLEPLSALAS